MKKAEIERIVADLVTLVDPGDAQTVEIMLMPWGEVALTDGRGNFVVDDESAALIAADFAKKKKDVPIDFEHTTVGGNFATPSGAAPASGWITKVFAKPGQGIYAAVKWNAAAKAMIRADEYRYLSPVVIVRKDDRKAVAVNSAALTNTPAIVDMERIAAKENAGDDAMNFTELKAALIAAGVAVKDDAEGDEILDAAKLFVEGAAKKSAEPPPLSAVAAKLGLDPESSEEAIVAKVTELQTYVSPTEYKVVTTRLEALELAAKDRQAQELVANAIEAAKLNPNDEKQMTWARGYAKADAVGFKAWSDNSPELYTAGRMVNPSDKLDKGDERQTLIAAAKAEYTENQDQLHGVEKWAFVESALTLKGLSKLTAVEKKALTV